MPSLWLSSNPSFGEPTARRVHSPSHAMSTIVVVVTLVAGSTYASTPRRESTKARRCCSTALRSISISGPSERPARPVPLRPPRRENQPMAALYGLEPCWERERAEEHARARRSTQEPPPACAAPADQ